MQPHLIQWNGRKKKNERKIMFENDYSSLLGWYSLWEVGRLAGLRVRTLWGVADLQFKNIQQKQKESWSSGLKMRHTQKGWHGVVATPWSLRQVLTPGVSWALWSVTWAWTPNPPSWPPPPAASFYFVLFSKIEACKASGQFSRSTEETVIVQRPGQHWAILQMRKRWVYEAGSVMPGIGLLLI